MTTLKSTDTTDRAFGLGGMAVAMVVWESERFMQSLDIDAPADLGLALYPEFFMIRSPKASPREAWNDAVEKFQLGTGLLISNLLCRALVRQNTEITPQMRQSLVRSLEDEGRQSADLTPAEVEALFSKAYSYFHKIFSHPAVADLTRTLCSTLESERHLGHERVMEILAPLQRL